MAIYSTADPLLSLPATANGVTVTPSGVTETYSAWFEITPSASTDMRVATIIALPGAREVGNYYEVELGVGAAAAEAAVCAVRGYSGANIGAAADGSDAIALGIPADVISSGDRVSCRLKQTSTSTAAWRVSFEYWALPMTGNVPGATLGTVNVPAGSRLTVSSGAANAYGAWVQVTGAADGDWTISNAVVFGGTNQNFVDWDLQIGTGPAASETPLWNITGRSQFLPFANGRQGGPYNVLLRPTLGPVASGTRVAVRMRSTSGVNSWRVGLTVIKEDGAGASTALTRTATAFTGIYTAAGGITVFSAWTQFIASAATDIALVGMAKSYQNAGQTGYCVVQVGVGGAGSETLVAEWFVSTGIWGGGRFNFPLPIARLIASGSRVSARIATAYPAAGILHGVALEYINIPGAPDFDNISTTLVQQAYYTVNSTGTVVAWTMPTSASAWTSGPWTEIYPAGTVALTIVGYEWENPATNIEVEVDLGVGDAGSESVISTIRWAAGTDISGSSMNYQATPMPIIITANERFVMRSRCSVAGIQTIKLIPHYVATEDPPDPPEPPVTPTLEGTEYEVRWLRRTPHVAGTGERVFHKKLQIDMETGQGNEDNTLPVVWLRSSDDGGATWGSIRQGSVSRRGVYGARVQWMQLGQARDRVYEISGSGRGASGCIVQGWLDAEAGTS